MLPTEATICFMVLWKKTFTVEIQAKRAHGKKEKKERGIAKVRKKAQGWLDLGIGQEQVKQLRTHTRSGSVAFSKLTEVLSLQRNCILQSSHTSFCSKLTPYIHRDKRKGNPLAVRKSSEPFNDSIHDQWAHLFCWRSRAPSTCIAWSPSPWTSVTTQHFLYAHLPPALTPVRQSRDPSRLLSARRNAILKELSPLFSSLSYLACLWAPSSPRKAGAPLVLTPTAPTPQSPLVAHILFLIVAMNVTLSSCSNQSMLLPLLEKHNLFSLS